MKTLRPLLVLSLVVAVVVLAAGCGGGGGSSKSVPADAVAVVGGQPVSKAEFNELMSGAQGEDKVHGQPFPKVGTPQYTQLRSQAVAYLVQAAEFQQEGKKIGVTITQQDVDKRVKQISQQYYKGDQKKLAAALKATGLTLPQYEQQLAISLLAQKIGAKVTAKVKVSKADAKAYYDKNKTQYTAQAQTSRSVRHILVDSKSLAEKLETKLHNGASFAVLAKKYSKDTGSAAHGGQLTAVKGKLVKPFENVAFSLKTGAISQPVHSVYGWHIIQALGPVKNTPKHVTPFKQVEAAIQQNLLQAKQGAAFDKWRAQLQKDFKGKVAYQSGYAPAPAATTGATTTTTSGTTTVG